VQARRPRNQSDQVSPRALAAIAEATRRSREAGVGPEPRRSRPPELPDAASRVRGNTPAWPVHDSDTPPTPPASGRLQRLPPPVDSGEFTDFPADTPRRRFASSNAAERRLRWAIGITVGTLVVVVAALIGTANRGGGQPDGRTTAPTGSPGAVASTAPRGPTAATSPHDSASSSSSSTSTSTSTVLAEPGGPPALSALAPASGLAGQRVTVTGSNFLSSSGQISAEVGGRQAPVACPDQTTCTVVIPPDVGSNSSVSVTITTDSGTSNALDFTLG